MSEPVPFAFASPAGAAGIEQDPVNAWYDRDARLLVDTGYGVDAAWLERLGAVDVVVVTHHHPDHDGGLAAVRRRYPGARVYVPDPLRAPGGEAAGEGTAIADRFIAWDAPGHCAPHVVLVDAAARAAFTGDLVLGRGTPWVGPPEGSLAAFFASVERLRDWGCRRIYPGHGPAVGREQIEWTLDHRHRRLDQVVAELQRGATTVGELLDAIYVRGERMSLSGFHRTVAEWTVRGYLEYLQQSGRVGQDGERWLARD